MEHEAKPQFDAKGDSALLGKKILLGVSGGIAAYKAALLVRLLVKAGATVRVVMTDAAKDFITPLTLATLSKNPVECGLFDANSGVWTNHVELGLWADLLVIAPATASTISKASHGQSDSLLLTTYLSARCPVLWCPAMDLDMYAHPATQANLALLASYGDHVLEAESGELASGLDGQGRLPEPGQIVSKVRTMLAPARSSLSGKRVLITAGPTYERLDPVRYIGNFSSGKMGLALAQEAAERGMEVYLVLGPTHLPQIDKSINIHHIESADDMLTACKTLAPTMDLMIFAAAVADYAPATLANEKIKKTDGDLVLHLRKTVDVAKEISLDKKPYQRTVGFALETSKDDALAIGKLAKKNLDYIVFNTLDAENQVFGADSNRVRIISPKGLVLQTEVKTKREIAKEIFDSIYA